MSTTYSSRLNLGTPGVADRAWNVTLDANRAIMEALEPLGGLVVALKEVPSASLNVKVAAGSYKKLDGTKGTYAGTASQAITTASTRVLYLDASGTLTMAAAYPSATHTPLATIVAGATTITSIDDDRVTCAMLSAATLVTFTQTYATADATFSAYTPDVESSAYTGIASGVGGTPYASLTDLNALRVAVENLRAHGEDIGKLLNSLIDALQAAGHIG